MRDHDDDIVNPSDNRPFDDIVAGALSRRNVLVGGAAVAGLFAAGPSVASGSPQRRMVAMSSAPSFTSIPLQGGPMPVVAPEYEVSAILPWRERLDGSGKSYAYDGFTSAQQARSIGIGHDGMSYFGNNTLGVLCLNHEFGTNPHVFGAALPTSLEQVRLSQHAHGVSVVTIARRREGWSMLAAPANRRIHGNTPMKFAGPAAASAKLATAAGNRPAGTLNNCANGRTPWGTYLTCEENFNGYFGATGAWTPSPTQARYGFVANGFDYGWHLFDARFDMSNPDSVNEENRFGWVVEINPLNPSSTPIKRTALGRLKHEGAAVTVGRGGRAVVYMGDDERFEYIYKFVSEGNWRTMLARGSHPLDKGTLYAARFNEDGTGSWLELTPGNPALATWSMEDILVNTRGAADAAGATPMDRPEWTSVGPDGRVYCTLTNNSKRTIPGPANPLAPNPDGHIVRWGDADDHVGLTFEWDIFAIAKDVSDAAGQMFGSPDGLWVDPDGRVFVETDGRQPGGNNDQLLVADSNTGEFRRLLSGVVGGEMTGLTTTPNRRTLFANVQHPGEGSPALTNFPEPFTGADGPIPRDATLVIRRRDGGVVGS